MTDLAASLRELSIANRILAREGVVDGFGHVTIRHPDKPAHFLMACSRSPALVTPDDIMTFGPDGEPPASDARRPYAERFIHAAMYEARPEVKAVIHNHSPSLIPFGVTKARLRPILHMAGCIGEDVKVWDIRRKFGDTNLLVVNMAHGRDLAAMHGRNRMTLMRGHGCTITGLTLQDAVITAVYAEVNARLQMQAMALGDVEYMTSGEVARTTEMVAMPLAVDRVWEYFVARADCSGI